MLENEVWKDDRLFYFLNKMYENAVWLTMSFADYQGKDTVYGILHMYSQSC